MDIKCGECKDKWKATLWRVLVVHYAVPASLSHCRLRNNWFRRASYTCGSTMSGHWKSFPWLLHYFFHARVQPLVTNHSLRNSKRLHYTSSLVHYGLYLCPHLPNFPDLVRIRRRLHKLKPRGSISVDPARSMIKSQSTCSKLKA